MHDMHTHEYYLMSLLREGGEHTMKDSHLESTLSWLVMQSRKSPLKRRQMITSSAGFAAAESRIRIFSLSLSLSLPLLVRPSHWVKHSV